MCNKTSTKNLSLEVPIVIQYKNNNLRECENAINKNRAIILFLKQTQLMVCPKVYVIHNNN